MPNEGSKFRCLRTLERWGESLASRPSERASDMIPRRGELLLARCGERVGLRCGGSPPVWCVGRLEDCPGVRIATFSHSRRCRVSSEASSASEASWSSLRSTGPKVCGGWFELGRFPSARALGAPQEVLGDSAVCGRLFGMGEGWGRRGGPEDEGMK